MAWLRAARRRGVLLLLLTPDSAWPALQAAAVAEPPTAPAAGGVALGDVFALADVLADMVGGPVILEDASFRVLSYSAFTGFVDRGRDAAILGRHMPVEWLQYLERTRSLERLRSSEDVIDLAEGPWHARRRLITSIRSGGRMFGVIWVAQGDAELPEDAASRLREAATLAAPHLVRHQESYRAQRLRRGELVRSLLEGRGQRQRCADELELPRSADLAVLAFAPALDEVPGEDVWDRVTDHVSLCCQAGDRQPAVTRIGTTVYAIIPGDADAVARLGRDVVRRPIPVLPARFRGAMSTAGAGLDALAARRAQADEALSVLGEAGCFVAYDDVRVQVILAAVVQFLDERPELRLPALAGLTADGRATLAAFLRAGGNVSAAARDLDIHATTLRYRLSRIEEVSGLSLEDPDERITCELLLRAGSL
jgi:DNA-binding PucR family transcriptional regulator